MRWWDLRSSSQTRCCALRWNCANGAVGRERLRQQLVAVEAQGGDSGAKSPANATRPLVLVDDFCGKRRRHQPRQHFRISQLLAKQQPSPGRCKASAPPPPPPHTHTHNSRKPGVNPLLLSSSLWRPLRKGAVHTSHWRSVLSSTCLFLPFPHCLPGRRFSFMPHCLSLFCHPFRCTTPAPPPPPFLFASLSSALLLVSALCPFLTSPSLSLALILSHSLARSLTARLSPACPSPVGHSTRLSCRPPPTIPMPPLTLRLCAPACFPNRCFCMFLKQESLFR